MMGLMEWLPPDSPWLWVVLWMVIALALTNHARSAGKRYWIVLALAGYLLAGGGWLWAYLVETPREMLPRLSRELVAATAPMDQAQVNALLDPRAKLIGPDGLIWIEAGLLRPALQNTIQSYQLQKNAVTQTKVEELEEKRGTVYLAVQSYFDRELLYGESVPTQWVLTWEKGQDEHWRITKIQWIGLYTREPTRDLLRGSGG